MAARGGGYGGRRKTGNSSVRIQPANGGKVMYVERRVIDQMKEATKATEEDIQITLRECGGDVNEATEMLIDCPFKIVGPKRQKSKQEEKKKPERGNVQRANGGPRGNEEGGGGARTPKSGRGTEGRGGSQNPSGQRGRGRGGGGAKNAHRQRGDDRKGQEGQLSNGESLDKENQFPDAATASPASEPAAMPAAPRKTGYADALCRGIGSSQPPRSVQATAPVGKASTGTPAQNFPTSDTPEPVSAKSPGIPSASAPVQGVEKPGAPGTSGPEKPLSTEKVDFSHVSQPAVDTINPPSPDGNAPSVSEPCGETQGAEAQFGHVHQILPELTAEESSVPIKGPSFTDLGDPARARISKGFLPVFLAPPVDLSLDTPPTFDPSETSFHFGSLTGIEDIAEVGTRAVSSLDGGPITTGESQVEMDTSIAQEQALSVPIDIHMGSAGAETMEEAQDIAEDIFPTSVSAPVPERVEQMLEPMRMDDVGTLALGDVYSQHVQDSLVDAKTDAATQVVVQEPETSRSVPEPSYASTGVQHTTYSIPSPAVSVTAQSAVTDYSKAVDKSAFQASQFTNELQDRSGADMKQPQQSYSVEGQVPSAHQHRQEQHQPMQEQRSAFETGQHNPNASPTIPPYQHRQKQDDRSGPAGAHASHAQQPRFAGQVSTGAQTDTNTLGNQVPQVAATHATSSSGPPPGAAVVPPVRPGPTPSPHVPQLPFASPMIPNPAMPFPAHYYPQYMQHQYGAMAYHGLYPGTYSYNGGFSHASESAGYPAPHIPPGGAPPKYIPQYNAPGVGASSVNQGYAANYPASGIYGLGGNTGYETSGGVAGYAAYKEKDNLPQPGQQHTGYGPGIGQQVPRSDVYYGVPGQGYSGQGFRNPAYHHQGYASQFGAGGPPPHSFHNVGGQQNNFSRLH